jgi:hypothetical protein
MGSTVKGDHINSLKLTGNIMKLYIQRTHCISVLCASQDKQLLFSYTSLTGWIL